MYCSTVQDTHLVGEDVCGTKVGVANCLELVHAKAVSQLVQGQVEPVEHVTHLHIMQSGK